MGGERYLSKIRDKFKKEYSEDIVTMIDILANERAEITHAPVSDDDFDFAAGIICVLLDPIKPDEYKGKIQAIRLSLRGISESRRLQVTFRNLLTHNLLTSPDAVEAIQSGYDALFTKASDNDS